jgi:branched-chain amino acid transport system substrate-binding protein
MVADLTGAFSPVTGLQGAYAYIDSVNAAGGVDGYKIVATTYDAASSPATALQAFRRAIADNPAAILEATIPDASALPLVAQSGIPAIGAGFVPGWTGHPTMFSPIGDVSTHLSDMWLLMLKHYAGATKIAVVTSPLEKADAELTASLGPAAGVKIVMDDTGEPNILTSASALSLAQRLKSAGATGVVMYGIETGESLTQADLNQLGGGVTVAQPGEFGPALIKEFGARINGELYGEAWVPPYVTGDPGLQEFMAAMNKYGYGSLIYTAPNNSLRYAQMKMLVEQGLKPAGAPFTHAAVVNSLSTLKNYTADGLLPNTTYPKFQQVGENCLSVMKVVNGQWVSLTNGTFPFFCGGPSLPTPSS